MNSPLSKSRLVSISITVAAAILVAWIPAFSQQSKIVQGGVIAGVPYASTEFENINLTNGALNLNFPLATLQGRGGVSHGYQLTYSSKLWQTITNPVSDPYHEPDPTYQTFMATNPVSGWSAQGGYEVRLWDRNSTMDQQGGPICEDGRIWQHVYRWKLEIVAPGGRTIEFRPTGYSDSHGFLGTAPRGYFNVKPDSTVSDVANCSVVTTTSGNRMTYYSIDGSGVRLTFANTENLGFVWEMSMPDGSRIIEKLGGGQKIIDKNGNSIESAVITLPDSSQVSGWIDDVGRWIARKTISSTEDHYYQKGFGGELLTWKVFWKNVYVRKPFVTTCAWGCSSGTRGPVTNQELVGSLRVVERIELPIEFEEEDFATYSFEYHAKNQADSNESSGWGEVKSVETPTGATISYGYPLSALDPQDEYNELFPNEIHLRTDQILSRAGSIDKKVLQYEEQYDGQTANVEQEWAYSIETTGSTVIGPDGGVSSQSFYDIVENEEKGGQVYKEVKSDGTIIERVWGNNYPVGITYGTGYRTNPLVKVEVITVPDALGSPALSMIKDHSYDMNGNVLSTAEYDWIPANSSAILRNGEMLTGFVGLTPARTTTTAFYNSTPAYTGSTQSSNAYYFATAPLLRNLPGAVEIENGSSTTVARNELYYDGSTSLSSSPTVGNPTQVRTWDNSQGSITSPLTNNNSVKTETTYNSSGFPLISKDANGIETRHTYGAIQGPTGPVTDLYPTQTIVAYGTNVARTSTATYDFHTGLVTSATDVDNGVTSATEYDVLGRPVRSIAAVGTLLEMWTRTEYDDFSRRVIVRSDLETKGDGRKVAVQHYDRLGRVRLSRTLENIATEDPYNENHGIKVQTRYETGSPNSYQLNSNPYRAETAAAASNEPTMGWTRSMSVNTGRHSETETFSGSTLPAPWGSNTNSTGKVKTDIDADRTLVTDQAGKSRISKTNALGQLKEVWEILAASEQGSESVAFPNTSIAHGFKTSYSYDTLSNLTNVNQGVQTRTFSYSSLSRLIVATNPESGTIIYGYDLNGNLTQKDDARGVRTNYVYDDLNRVINRNYSTPGGVPSNYQATPNVTYTYDASHIANSKGKLTKVASSVSTTEFMNFDILGRVTRSSQTTDGIEYGGESDTTRWMTYKYNLSGSLIEQQYPSGRVVKNVLDNDGGLSMVQSKKNQNFGYHAYVSNFTYNAAGAVTSLQLGNGRWESTAFNSRLQPVQIALGSTGTGAQAYDLLKLDYGYGTTNNNGNVLNHTITVPTVTIGGTTHNGFTAVQNFTYDALNRLDDAAETIGGNQIPSWRQDFKYDRYGNRNLVEANTTFEGFDKLCSNNTELCIDLRKMLNPSANTPDNRLSSSEGYDFDPSGNTVRDPQSRRFTYDGENKQVKVENLDLNGSPVSTVGNYVYDGDGKRVKKYVPSTGEVSVFVYDAGGKLIGEYSTVAQVQPPKVSYTTADHLGSSRILTDQNGVTLSRRDFHPYGEETYTPQRTQDLGYRPDDIRQRFTGYERDPETDLDYAKNRFHNHELGRFTSPDPYKIVAEVKFEKTTEGAQTMLKAYIAHPQKWNQYLYTINNPLRYTDPTGEEIWLRGTRKEIDEAQELLKEILGEERFRYVRKYDHSGGDDGYALVLNIDAKDVEAFSKIGDDVHNKALSEGMAQILSNQNVLEVRVDGKAMNLEGRLVNVDGLSGGNTQAGYVGWSLNINKHAQAIIGPDTVEKANRAAELPSNAHLATDDKPLRFTKAIALAHEIGHHWKRRDGTDGAVAFENAVRSRGSGNQRLRKSEN